MIQQFLGAWRDRDGSASTPTAAMGSSGLLSVHRAAGGVSEERAERILVRRVGEQETSCQIIAACLEPAELVGALDALTTALESWLYIPSVSSTLLLSERHTQEGRTREQH